MTIGDKLFVADKPTLDAIKALLGAAGDGIEVASAFGKLAAILADTAIIKGARVPSLLFPVYSFGGDGSQGDYTPGVNTEITAGIYLYNSLTIPVGVTVNIDKHAAVLLVKGKVTISGLLTATGKGWAANSIGDGLPLGSTGYATMGGGGGGGGYGGSNVGNYGGYVRVAPAATTFDQSSISAAPGGTVGSPIGANGVSRPLQTQRLDHLAALFPASTSSGNVPGVPNMFPLLPLLQILCGSSGGMGSTAGGLGGPSGGGVIIEADEIEIQPGGAIRADGIDGAAAVNVDRGGGGGGGGGFIWLRARSLAKNGDLSVLGGNGGAGNGAGSNGGAGGTGLIITEVVG